MQLCKEYLTCEHKLTCTYARPTNSILNTFSSCYDLVSERNYLVSIRKLKLEKLNGKIKDFKK